jgi:hypothetical protein
MRIRNRLKRSEVQAFRRRWKFVNAAEREELCNTSVDEKLEQLIMLMASAKELGWTIVLEGEINEVRDRWNELRKVYHV